MRNPRTHSSHSAITYENRASDYEQSIGSKKLNWLSMEETITKVVERVNSGNILYLAGLILDFDDDLIAGRGLFCRAVLKSQFASPKLTNVYASLVAVINSEFPDCGLLLVKRAVLRFKSAYDSEDKKSMESSSKLLAHLVNQAVVYPLLACDVLLLLLGNPSSDNVDVAVGFCVECGSSLARFASDKLQVILGEFDRVLRIKEVEKRVEVLIEKVFAANRTMFRDYPRVVEDLDIVQVEDQVTHDVSLLHDFDPENSVDEYDGSEITCDYDDDDDEDEVSSRAN